MIEVKRSQQFVEFLTELIDLRARTKIMRRIDRLEEGNPGDVRPVGHGISEMRIQLWAWLSGVFHSSR